MCYALCKAWVLQFGNTALEMAQSQARIVQSTSPSTSAIRDNSSSSSVVEEHVLAVAAPVSKKATLFDFINPRLRDNISSATIDKLSHAHVKQQYGACMAVADEEMYERGLQIFNVKRFNAQRPLARQNFTAPASSAASERVFSKAGLIMRPARSRLSRANVSKLVFLSCN